MIIKAVVKIYDKKQDKVLFIPCHRHSDAYEILHEFGYQKDRDYVTIEQGFYDDNDCFYNRVAAKKHAIACGQIDDDECKELFSEELY